MSDCTRWIALSDREALGEPLGAEERALLASHPQRCAGCGAERDVWRSLEAVDLAGRDGEPSPAHTPASPRPPGLPAPVAPRRSLRRSVVAAMAAAAALALFAGAASRSRAPTLSRVVASVPIPPAGRRSVRVGCVSGEVDVDGARPVAGAPLVRGAVVSVGAGTLCLAVGDGIRACLAPGARVRVVEGELPDRTLAVLSGRVVAELEPQPPGRRFTLASRDGSATAIGTAFSVEVPEGGGPVVTRVLHGTVLVQPRDAAPLKVGAHAEATMSAAPPTPLGDAEEERDRAVLVPAVAAGSTSW